MAFSARETGKAKSDMNVVPLIDILLVLLIIFMVTAPTPTLRIDITLPQRALNPPEQQREPPPPLNLRIASSGEITINNTPQPLATLGDYFADVTGVRQVLLPPADQPMLAIEVDPNAEFEVLARVLARARDAEMARISFVDQAAQ